MLRVHWKLVSNLLFHFLPVISIGMVQRPYSHSLYVLPFNYAGISSPIFLFVINTNSHAWIVLSKTIGRYYIKEAHIMFHFNVSWKKEYFFLSSLIYFGINNLLHFFVIFPLPTSCIHLLFSIFLGFIVLCYCLFK